MPFKNLFSTVTLYITFLPFLLSCGQGLCPMNECIWRAPYGILDNSFGTAGIAQGNVYNNNQVSVIYFDLISNKFYTLGTNSTATEWALASYNYDLSSNTSFGTNGYANFDLGSAFDTLYHALTYNNQLIGCGFTGFGAARNAAVARFNLDGALDTTFGTSAGFMYVDYFGSTNECIQAAVQTDGKIVFAGRGLNANYDFTVTRLNTDGTLDTTFATAGKYSLDLSGTHDGVNSTSITSNQQIIIAGQNGNFDLGMIRLTPSGVLDTTFGTGGIVTQSFAGVFASARKILTNSDGSFYAVGYYAAVPNTGFILKYLSNGSLDTSFNNTGLVSTLYNNVATVWNDAAFQNDGKILLLGSNNGNKVLTARINTNGQFDSSFGNQGFSVTSLTNYSLYGSNIKIQPNGTFFIGGSGQNTISLSYYAFIYKFR